MIGSETRNDMVLSAVLGNVFSIGKTLVWQYSDLRLIIIKVSLLLAHYLVSDENDPMPMSLKCTLKVKQCHIPYLAQALTHFRQTKCSVCCSCGQIHF